jgi:hypothetical protein
VPVRGPDQQKPRPVDDRVPGEDGCPRGRLCPVAQHARGDDGGTGPWHRPRHDGRRRSSEALDRWHLVHPAGGHRLRVRARRRPRAARPARRRGRGDLRRRLRPAVRPGRADAAGRRGDLAEERGRVLRRGAAARRGGHPRPFGLVGRAGPRVGRPPGHRAGRPGRALPALGDRTGRRHAAPSPPRPAGWQSCRHRGGAVGRIGE